MGPPTGLRAALLGATATRDANDMLHRFYGDEWPRARVAALAPLVDAAALAGDGVAGEILNRAAQELALLAAAVRSQLWKPGERVEVAYIGGAFESRTLLERFRLLVELDDGAHCAPPLRTPAEGAYWKLIGLSEWAGRGTHYVGPPAFFASVRRPEGRRTREGSGYPGPPHLRQRLQHAVDFT